MTWWIDAWRVRVFFFLGYRSTDRSIWQNYVSIHEVTLPWELTVMAWETCSTVVAKWQIVSSTRGWGKWWQLLNTNKVGADDCCNLPVAVKCLRQTAKPFLSLLLWVFVSEFTENTAQQLTQLKNFLISLGHMAPCLVASIGTPHPMTPASWNLGP